MISKTKIKYIRSLELKKNRRAENAFIAEGHKLVGDLLGHFECRLLVATREWLSNNTDAEAGEIIEVSREELSRASLLQTPQDVLGVFTQRTDVYDWERQWSGRYTTCPYNGELALALDDVQDPGNLGTIVRIADWFGIHDIFCSQGTADIYNPKTVQATMGAIARVRVHYCDLPEFISSLRAGTRPAPTGCVRLGSGSGRMGTSPIPTGDMRAQTSGAPTSDRAGASPIFGTFLDGEDIYSSELSPTGLIVMGNEGKGISPEVAALIDHRLLIPSYPKGMPTSESLNVAVATAIVCSEFRRKFRIKN